MGRNPSPAAKNLKTADMSPNKDVKPPRFAEWLLRIIHSDKGDFTHLGDFNDLMLAGTLAGLEMGLSLAGIPFSKGGVAAALDYLEGTYKES